MFLSKIYPFPYTENKVKNFVVFVTLLNFSNTFHNFSFFHPFQCHSCISCRVKSFYYFLGGLHLFGDSFSHFYGEQSITLGSATIDNFKFQ